MGILPDPRGSSLGALSLPGQSSENLEEVPRIWEGEGSRRSEILNPINNDYWVCLLAPTVGPRAFLGPRGVSERPGGP